MRGRPGRGFLPPSLGGRRFVGLFGLFATLLTASSIAIAKGQVPESLQTRQPSPDSVLTVKALTQLTVVWTAFMQAPDSLRRSLIGTLGTVTPLVAFDTVYSGSRIDRIELVQNIPALAARDPSIGLAFTRAALTSQRYHVLFVTLLNTCRTFAGMTWENPVTPTPLEATNIAFLTAHQRILDTLVTRAHAMYAWSAAPVLGTKDCGRMANALGSPQITH